MCIPYQFKKMPASEKIEKSPEKDVDSSNKEEVEIIYLKEHRSAYTDIILCSTTIDTAKNTKKTTKYEVEKAMLACHSTTFLNMFADCSTQSKDKVAEISIPEPASIVTSFLHCIYATFQEQNKVGNDGSSFDHWIDVIAMGDKYLANIVIERSIFHLCKAFGSLANKAADVSLSSLTRYGAAAFLKLILIYNSVRHNQLDASPLAVDELERTLKDHWRLFCTQCDIELDNSPCGCDRTRKNCCMHKHQSLCSLRKLLPEYAGKFFAVRQVLAFQAFIEDLPKYAYDIIKVLRIHFDSNHQDSPIQCVHN